MHSGENVMNTTSEINDKGSVERAEKSPKETVTFNILRHMKINHMSQKELAALAGVRATTVNNWIRGISTPSMENLIKLAEIFRMSEADFFYDQKDGDTRNKYSFLSIQKQDLLKLYDKNTDFHRYVEIGLSAVRSGRISELLKQLET
jgi:transcriptional regulator with XRE-family HTH domain